MMDKGEALVVFPLSKIEYNNLHIRGSVNIDLENIAKELPSDKSRKIVFYCLGEQCTASWRAAEKAVSLGYRDIYTFRAGLPAWVAAGYPTETIEKLPEVKLQKISTDDLQGMLLRDPDLVLLDVCLEVDARKFWIDSPKRIHIPADDMQDRYGNIPRGKKVAVICLKGTRAPTIIRYLTAKGYKNLLLVEGGMQKWIMEGKPVKTSS
jgi:rhodanese-related sulfurtransferase